MAYIQGEVMSKFTKLQWQLLLLFYIAWTPIYLFSNSSVDEIEELTLKDIIPSISSVGISDEEIKNKARLLELSGIETDKGMLDVLRDIDGVSDIETRVINTKKVKIPNFFLTMDLDTVELKFNGKNNKKYRLEFSVMDKSFIVPLFSKFIAINSIGYGDDIGEYSNTKDWIFFEHLYKKDGAQITNRAQISVQEDKEPIPANVSVNSNESSSAKVEQPTATSLTVVNNPQTNIEKIEQQTTAPSAKAEQPIATTTEIPEQAEKEPAPVVKPVENTNSTSATETPPPSVPTTNQQISKEVIAAKVEQPIVAEPPVQATLTNVEQSAASQPAPANSETQKETTPTNAEQHVQKMLEAAMNNDEGSIKASEQYLENQPKPAKGDKKAAREVNDEALIFIKNQQYAQAIPLLEKASQTDPSDVEILNNYGFALMMSNNLEQAKTVLIKTLVMKPNRVSAWSNLGYAFALQGKEDMATACYLNTYRFSKNPEKTLQFFKDQLAQEKNPNLRSAMIKAVEKAPAPSENTLQTTASQKVPDNSQSQEETNIKAQNKLDAENSVYTSLEEKSCKILESHDDEGGGFISSCPGHAGYQIQIEGGDARSWLIILKNKRPVYDSQTDFLKHPTGNFAAINRKVLEWRYDNAKKLIGLIVRVVAQDKSESPKEISDLFVFRHDNGQFCYAGTHKTNEGAREIADSQTGCKP
jgi:Flp pilus assembly protein TadD